MCTAIPHHRFGRGHSPLSACKRSRSCLGRGGACRKSLIILFRRPWREPTRVGMSVGMTCPKAASHTLSLTCQQASAKVPHTHTFVIDSLISETPFKTLQPCMPSAQRAHDIIVSCNWHGCGSHYLLTVSKQRFCSIAATTLSVPACEYFRTRLCRARDWIRQIPKSTIAALGKNSWIRR